MAQRRPRFTAQSGSPLGAATTGRVGAQHVLFVYGVGDDKTGGPAGHETVGALVVRGQDGVAKKVVVMGDGGDAANSDAGVRSRRSLIPLSDRETADRRDLAADRADERTANNF